MTQLYEFSKLTPEIHLIFAENNFGPLLIAFFAKQPNPFKRLINKHNPLDSKYQDVVNIAVHCYQAHSYLDLIEAEYGPRMHNIAQQQVDNLFELNNDEYDFYTITTSLINFAIDVGQLEVTDQGKRTKVPLELNIAVTLLIGLPGSPHYATEQQSRNAEIQKIAEDVDLQLAQYLAKGKTQVVAWFSRLSKSYMKTITQN